MQFEVQGKEGATRYFSKVTDLRIFNTAQDSNLAHSKILHGCIISATVTVVNQAVGGNPVSDSALSLLVLWRLIADEATSSPDC